MKLMLGVNVVPYANAPRGKRAKASSGTVTTGDVAGWLENKYQVMERFADKHAPDIAKALEDSLGGALETLMSGGPLDLNVFGEAESKIYDQFQKFIDTKEMDRMGVPGVPTKASLIGISKRFKNRRNPGRPSFVDSGLYEANFRAWIEE